MNEFLFYTFLFGVISVFIVSVASEERQCISGQLKTIECNKCNCHNDKWNCTTHICPPVYRLKRAQCSEGQTRSVDCNKCSCRNGKWQCTLKLCSPKQQCIPGQLKTIDCNQCNCYNGKWTCTTRICPSVHRPKRGVPVSSELKNTPCAPNDYFKIDCNTCYCNIDKTGYLCTENLCPYTDSSTTEPPSNDTSTSNYTLSVNQTVFFNETITLNKTIDENVTEIIVTNKTVNKLELELLIPNNTNITQSLSSKNSSSNYSDSDGGGTNEFSCTPGQAFKKDCNTCTCTPDGKNAICTVQSCTEKPSNATD